jgi:TolB-like protein
MNAKGILMKLRWITPFLVLLIALSFLLLPSSTPWSQTRDTQKVYKVAILPFLIHSQENLDYLREGIYDILASRVIVEGRITVIDRSSVERALYEERPMRLDEAVAAKIGARVGADYIVLGSLTKVGDYISLDARLISVTEDKPPLGVFTQSKGIDDVMVKIGDFAQDIGTKILGRRPPAGRAADSRSSYIQTRKELFGSGEGFKRSQTFNFEIKGVDVGDVDGDKKNEIVVIDHHNIYIFKYDGEKLNLFQKIETGYQYDFLTLDVADVNRNGVAEIIVTAVVEDDVRSFIIEFEEGKFRKITEKSGWFFRVLDHPKEGPVLMGKLRGSEGIPVGPIYKMVWKKKSYEKGPKMDFPNETSIFGIAMADLRGKGKPELISLDDYGHLNIVSEDKKNWVGGDRFGGTNNFYETRKKKVEPYRPQESPPWRVYIPGRVLIRDLDGNGVPEIVVNKNEFASGTLFEKLKIYEKGEVYNLVWEENRLLTNWKTKDIPGYIVDFQIKDVENKGEEGLVVALVLIEEGASGALSRKTESALFFFKLF